MANLNINEQATKSRQLKPRKDLETGKWKHNGFAVGKLVGVRVEEYDYKSGEFQDQKVPKLIYDFESFNPNAPREVFSKGYSIPAAKKYENQGDKNSSMVYREKDLVIKEITDLWKFIKHYNDVYAGKSNYRDFATLTDKEVALYLNDLPEAGEPGDRIAKFKKFFDFIAAWMNGTYGLKKDAVAAPVYVNKDGSAIALWIKMIRTEMVDSKGRKTYRHDIPQYLGTGVVEVIRYEKDKLKPTVLVPIAPQSIEIPDLSVLDLPERGTAPGTQSAGGAVAGAPPVDNVPQDVTDLFD